ncbi:MAG: lipase [Lentisphaerae bacterium GWF2_44_16]|nr:MAG: lipase [Lentisphaerae bacterium GWF2_44_16]
MTADRDTYLRDISVLLSKIWPANRTVNIVCHGHSVPGGYFGFHVVNTFNAYPHLLHLKLKERYPMALINVIVTAVGGENSESGAERFERGVLCHKPDLITMDYALNDCGIGLERSHKAWSSMIEKALSQNIKIILLTPTGRMDDKAEILEQHAEQIKSLADKYGLGLADSFAGFKNYCLNGGELSDLMSWINHPNRKGHEIVAEKIMQWFPILSPGEIK